MDRFNLAEKILRAVCTRSRAEEIVGDLLEQSDSSSSRLGFWLTICRIMFSMGWRWILAVIAAFWSFALPVLIFFTLPLASHGPQRPNLQWGRVIFSLMACSAFTFSSAVLSLVRFGMKGPLNRMALFLTALFVTALFVTVACFARFPAVIFWVPLAIAMIIVGLLLYLETRRPLISILCVSGVQAVVCAVGLEFVYRIQPNLVWPVWLPIGLWAMSIGAGAYVLSVIRKRADEGCATPHFD